MNKTVKLWDKISVFYTWKLENWKTFDSNVWQSTLDFKVWAWDMIEWFDEWVVWMEVWEKKTIKIPANKAYGEYDENNKQTLRKKDLVSYTAAWYTLEIWDSLPFWAWEVTIVDADSENITIDTNHFLAWKDLIFEIEVVKIK